ncbi:MAG: glycosyltransferase, partial [Tepidisphaeraceae bacterium]
MRVLHVSSGIDPRQGGPTTVLTALIAAQIEAGLRVSVAATFGEDFRDDAARQMRECGATVELIGPCTHRLAWHKGIRPALGRMIGDADIVHIHGVWEEIQHQAAKIARRRRVAYIITPHGMLDPWSLARGGFKKRLYLMLRLRRHLNRAAAVHFSDATERDLTLRAVSIRSPALVQRHIVDLREFDNPPPRGTFRQRFPATTDKPIVLFLSRLHPKKGLNLLIAAFADAE